MTCLIYHWWKLGTTNSPCHLRKTRVEKGKLAYRVLRISYVVKAFRRSSLVSRRSLIESILHLLFTIDYSISLVPHLLIHPATPIFFSQLQKTGQYNWPGGRRLKFATKLALGAKFVKYTKLAKNKTASICVYFFLYVFVSLWLKALCVLCGYILLRNLRLKNP